MTDYSLLYLNQEERMSARPISMRYFAEILRLKHEAKLSQRQIARALKISLGAVNKYLNAADKAGISYPLPENSTEPQLRRLLFPPSYTPSEPTYAQIDFAYIHQELKRKGVSRQLLWEEYVQANPNNHYQYAQFCWHYHQWAGRLNPSMRQTHIAGEKMFVDYAGQTIPIYNSITREITQAQIFIAVLGASNYTYAEATTSQSLFDWIGSHIRAFEFFGGVPKLVVPDNLKSGVTRADKVDPVINRSYQDMLSHYGTAALPARPYHPKDKAKVEVAVQIVERWILARIRNHAFFSLTELNDTLKENLLALNDKPLRKLPGSRQSQFDTIDRPVLMPLPDYRYEYAEWKRVRAHIDYHVEIDGHFYSVPYSLIKQQMDAKLTATTIECFHQNQRVAFHQRSITKGGHTTVAEHMPSHHRIFGEWNPGRFMNWASSIGPSTLKVIKQMLDSRSHPELAFRACFGVMKLANRYTPARLEAACERALTYGSVRYRSVQKILELGLDKQPLSNHAEDFQITVTEHENLRGSQYYQ